jgi:dethiobiotin synthetase
MKKGLFITGTDTGVGKTYVGAGLIRAFTAMGYTVCPMKPVETGCTVRYGRLIPGDTRQLIRASGVNESVESINPYRFRHPLAPSVAAELEGVVIKKQKILSAYRSLSKH